LPQANTVLDRFCTDYNQRFARPAAESVRDFRSLPAALISPAASVALPARRCRRSHSHLGANSIALPPLPGHRGYAGETVELAHHLDGMLHIYRGDRVLLALPLPLQEHAARRPAPITTAQKRKTSMPRIYNLGGRPALAAVT